MARAPSTTIFIMNVSLEFVCFVLLFQYRLCVSVQRRAMRTNGTRRTTEHAKCFANPIFKGKFTFSPENN